MTDNEAYDEPDVENDDYPDHWTPKQCENWDNHGQEIYENLETEVGRYWFRRSWRPKKRGSGLMERDHVKFGTPEDYVVYEVEDRFKPMGSIHGSVMRSFSSFSADKDELERAIADIFQAKFRLLPDHEQARIAQQANKVADLYGIEL